MISLELAKKLKEAGLEWEPKLNDNCYYGGRACTVVGIWEYVINAVTLDSGTTVRGHNMYFTFLPRLDQLLAEIERRGYEWDLSRESNPLSLPYNCVLYNKGSVIYMEGADTPEDVAALALLWILGQEKVTTDAPHTP